MKNSAKLEKERKKNEKCTFRSFRRLFKEKLSGGKYPRVSRPSCHTIGSALSKCLRALLS